MPPCPFPLLACSGAVWGVLPWLAYTGSDPFVDFFTIAMLVGMTAGAVNSAAALPRALNLYVALALAPFVVRAGLLGGVVNWGGALTIVFSIVVLVGFGRNAYRAQRATLLATRQNLHLASALRRERDAVQAASRAKDLFLAGVTHDLRQRVHALALHLRHLRCLRASELDPAVVDTLVAPMDTAAARARPSVRTTVTSVMPLNRRDDPSKCTESNVLQPCRGPDCFAAAPIRAATSIHQHAAS